MIPSTHDPTARRAAYDALVEILEKEAYANLTLQHSLRRYDFSGDDIRFLTELVYGVCRRYNYLLWILARLSTRPVKKMDASIRILLCLGLYQILFLQSVPDSAAVNETVKIAKAVSHEGNVRFTNAILRNYLRKKESLILPDPDTDPVAHDALLYNEPEWLVKRWTKQWGQSRAREIFTALNQIAPTDIRCNSLKIPFADLWKRLEDLGAEPGAVSFCPEGITLGKSGPFFRSSLLKDGLAYVQNRASMVPAMVLAPEPEDRVLDMCAAPGSKTTQLAARMGDRGHIDAWDIYPHKINLIRSNCRALGIHSVHARVQDARADRKELVGCYDRVLLDAPCSGLGVIRRKPEIRWRRTEQDLSVFPALQNTLLDRAADYVKPGGVLVYSTCTLVREENEGQVQDFLMRHPEFSAAPFSLPGMEAPKGMLTLYPDTHQSDGFFVSRLVRRKL